MRKTPSLFCRNYEGDRLVRDEVVPGSEWVLAGEGVATRKWDGTSCLWRDGMLWKRYDRKLTQEANKAKRTRAGEVLGALVEADFKPAPPGWLAAEEAPNLHTGHWPGWLPVGPEPESKWHLGALRAGRPKGVEPLGFGIVDEEWIEGQTYELCGPHFQGNPEGLAEDVFIRHGCLVVSAPRDFDGIRSFLAAVQMEGIVWHHEDGRMVKIKAGDFGIAWPRVECRA